MSGERFVFESVVPAPPEAVFAWHERPEALRELTPPFERAEIVAGGGSLRVGEQVKLRVRFGPFSLGWVAEHVEYDPPRRFVDVQRGGPFASWRHTHHFDPDGAGGTQMRDIIEYCLPFGALGRWLGGAMVRRKLERMFAWRHERVRQAFGAG